MKTLRFVLFFCFLGIIFSGYAQEITLLDKTTKEPITGVAIFNVSKTKSAISDFDGKVLIDAFDANEVIYFKHLSYIDVNYTKRSLPLILYLEANAQSLEEVVISASKFEQSKKEAFRFRHHKPVQIYFKIVGKFLFKKAN